MKIDLRTCMEASIGFEKEGRYYAHPECPHLFAIGEDTRLRPIEKQVEGRTIKILSPTDCIKDRLSSYVHFRTRDTLEQVVLVALSQPYKITEVKR